MVHRTARCGLRVTRGQRRRLFGLLLSAGDVWACVLELNAWRRRRQDTPLAGYQELCRELAASGPGTFGELDSTGARSVLRRYSDAWFAAAKRRKDGDTPARYPRRRRRLVPVRWYSGTFTLDGRVLRLPVANGCPPLQVRLDRDVPYPAGQVRSVTLLFDAGRLCRRRDRRGPGRRPTRTGGPRTRPGWRGWTWASSTRTRLPGRTGRGCWCPGGRSAPNAVSTCATARAAPGQPPAGHRSRAARVAAVAAVPPRPAARRGPARAAGPPGPARSRQARH